MTDKRPQERSALDTAKLWLEQRNKKAGGALPSLAPHTPPAQRSLSTYSSPGSILGKEEDAVIIELTSRYLLAGTEGESGPQCRISFGPQSCRRVGDYRHCIPGYKRKGEGLATWGKEYELWRNDLTGVDLGLTSDVLERTVREVYNKHLLVDAGSGRLVLVLPSLVPHAVIETILATLFKRWKYGSITLLPSPTMAIIAAGLRSGLVVDIGWEETIVTLIYEYREVSTYRTTRAVKMMTQNFAMQLKQTGDAEAEQSDLCFDLNTIEEMLLRSMATVSNTSQKRNMPTEKTESDRIQAQSSDSIDVEWPTASPPHIQKFPRASLKSLLLDTLSGATNEIYPDDHEIPLPQLMFKALFSVSPDARGTCMSRIIFTGHLALPQFIRSHLLQSLESTIRQTCWATTSGKHTTAPRSGLNEIAQARTQSADAKHNIRSQLEKEDIEEGLQKQKAKSTSPTVQGELREVHSLGAWAGASLLVSNKIRGVVEIERDRFLSHGLAGGSRDIETSVAAQSRGLMNHLTSAKPADRSSWTLGGWG